MTKLAERFKGRYSCFKRAGHLVKAVCAGVEWVATGEAPEFDNEGPYRHLFENKFYEEMAKTMGFGPCDLERLMYVGNNLRRYYTE